MFGWFKKNKKVEKPEGKEDVKKVEVEELREEPKEEVKEEQVEEVKEDQKVVFDEETGEKEEVQEEKRPEQKKRKMINHITKHKDGGWQIKKGGAQRALKRFKTQKEAIEFAKGLEETTGIAYIIHKANGTTRKKKY